MSLLPTTFPYLSCLLVILFAGAALIYFMPAAKARIIALSTSLLSLGLSLGLLSQFDSQYQGFQWVEQHQWIESLNIQYLIGVDGLSILFLPATSLLFSLVILSSWHSLRTFPRLYFALLLILQACFIGVFTALDTIFFFLFWELTLIPFYFLISLWGVGPDRRYAANKYTLFMLSGGITLLFAWILLASYHPDGLHFDYPSLLDNAHDNPLQTVIFFLLLLGFAVKTPIFPLHAWLPVSASESPVNLMALIAGLKIGAYGLLRFTLPLAPDAAHEYQWLLVGLGMLGMLYGAVAALSQSNLRQMLAFSSLAHISLVLIGIASLNQQGIQGAIFQLLNFTLISAGLFMLSGFLHQRTGSTDVVSLGGVARTMPLLATGFLILGLASMGVPSTSGFPAELLLIIAAFKQHTGAGLVTLFTVVLGAGYFLSIYRRAFLGEAKHTVIQQAVDLRPCELLVLGTILLIVFFFGFYPQPILNLIQQSSLAWLELMK